MHLRNEPLRKEQDMKTGICIIAAAALAMSSVQAAPKAENHRGEGIGIGGGGIAGAIAGGPIGFLIGAATGGWLGNKFDREKTTRERLEEKAEDAELRLTQAEQLSGSLQALVETSEDEVAAMRVVMLQQEEVWRDALREAFNVEVYFHTGEATLDPNVANRVARLGEILREFDDFSIVIEGHADSRGEAAYNEQLSAERAESVRDALLRAGLSVDRITTTSAGESQSTAMDGDLDAMALERRVDLNIVYPLPPENRVARQ
jgi:outer membrane protein OmpA-like peptidoglycan-associated protein